jgi:hypothetical protein
LIVFLTILVNVAFCDIPYIMVNLTTKVTLRHSGPGKEVVAPLTPKCDDEILQINNQEMVLILTTVVNRDFCDYPGKR